MGDNAAGSGSEWTMCRRRVVPRHRQIERPQAVRMRPHYLCRLEDHDCIELEAAGAVDGEDGHGGVEETAGGIAPERLATRAGHPELRGNGGGLFVGDDDSELALAQRPRLRGDNPRERLESILWGRLG